VSLFAPGSTGWMIRHEMRLTWRYMIGLTGGKTRGLIVMLCVLGAMALLFGIPVGYATRFLTGARMERGWPIIVLVAGAGSIFIFTLMLAQSLSMATIVFYDRGDLDLLLTAPIKPQRILTVRMLAMVANGVWGFLAFLAPFLICAAVVGGHWGWLSVFPMIIAFSLMATALGVAGAMGLVRILGPRRTRTAAQVLGVMFGATSFLLGESYNIMGRKQGGIFYKGLFDWVRTHGSISWLAWPARAATGQPVPLLVVLTTCVLVFVLLNIWLGRGFADNAAAAAGAAERNAQKPAKSRKAAFRTGLMRVMIGKELKLVFRDPTVISQVALQALYIPVIGVIVFRNLTLGHQGLAGAAAFASSAGALTFLSGQIAAGLGWLTISAEDAPELLACAPITQLQAAHAKVAAVVIPIVILVAFPALAMAWFAIWPAICAVLGAAAAAVAVGFIELWNQKPAKRSQFRMRRRGSGSSLVYFADVAISALIAGAAGLAAAGWVLWAFIPAAVALTAVMIMKKDKWLHG
jgi:ABC-2 type transport system permease protein